MINFTLEESSYLLDIVSDQSKAEFNEYSEMEYNDFLSRKYGSTHSRYDYPSNMHDMVDDLESINKKERWLD